MIICRSGEKRWGRVVVCISAKPDDDLIITSVTNFLAATTKHLPELKVFFSVVLLLLIGSAIYIVRNRKKFFGHTDDPGDTRASANLRMWMIVLILIHAIIVTTIMIFEV